MIIWAVNGSQSEVLVIGNFKINCQGHDIEIISPIFFVYNQAMFYEKGNTFSIVS